MRAIALAASTHILPCPWIESGSVRFRDKMLGREQRAMISVKEPYLLSEIHLSATEKMTYSDCLASVTPFGSGSSAEWSTTPCRML